MSEENLCPQCGVVLPGHTPQGLCPRCLLKWGLGTQTGTGEGGSQTNAANFVPPAPAELASHFPDLEILELVGRGGMGVVYKARQKRLDRLVALKILAPEVGQDPSFAERFAREARAMAMLNHPHIVAVYDFGQAIAGDWGLGARGEGPETGEGGRAKGDGNLAEGEDANLPSPLGRGAGGEGGESFEPACRIAGEGGVSSPRPPSPAPRPLYYFLMEFVDGVNLRLLLETGKLAPEEALAIVPQICDALQYAHDHGVVHRDIKPENVLLDKEGRVKIADFGIAKLMGRKVANGLCSVASESNPQSPIPNPSSLTATGQIVGTPQYMAPEQIEHPLQVDHRADIYSLGVVFYQMLTGELPIGRFAPPSKKVQIDVRLDEVVLRALEKEPERRYQQASEIKTRVETIATTAGQVSSGATAGLPSSASGATGSASASPSDYVQRNGMSLPNVDFEYARRQVHGPAIGLLVTGILNWVVTPMIVLILFYNVSARFVDIVPGVGLVPALFLNLVFSTLMILGSLKMERLEWRNFAIGASISAIIVTPGNLIGLPIGIWALVVLSQREVRAAFARRRECATGSDSALPSDDAHHTLPNTGGVSDTPALHRSYCEADVGAIARAKQIVNAPSIGLFVTGVLNGLVMLVVGPVLVWMNDLGNVGILEEIPPHLVLVLNMIFGAVPVFAAVKMRRLEGRSVVIAAAIVAVLSLVLLANPVGLICGIWTFVVLGLREVRMGFHERRQQLLSTASENAAAKDTVIGWTAMILCLVGLPIFGIVGPFIAASSAGTRLPLKEFITIMAFSLAFCLCEILALVLGRLCRKSSLGQAAMVSSAFLIATALLYAVEMGLWRQEVRSVAAVLRWRLDEQLVRAGQMSNDYATDEPREAAFFPSPFGTGVREVKVVVHGTSVATGDEEATKPQKISAEPTVPDERAIQGMWRIESVSSVKNTPGDEESRYRSPDRKFVEVELIQRRFVPGFRMSISGGEIKIEKLSGDRAGWQGSYSYALDPTSQPKKIRLDGDRGGDVSFPGIYGWDRDRLTICIGIPQPPLYLCNTPSILAAGPYSVLIALRRVSEATGNGIKQEDVFKKPEVKSFAASPQPEMRAIQGPSQSWAEIRKQPPAYQTAKITRGDIAAHYVAKNLNILPGEVAEVWPQVEGPIVSFGDDPRGATDPAFKGKPIDVESPVEIGAVLAKIDPERYRARVEQEEAAVKRAQAEVAKAEAILKQAETKGESKEVALASLDAAKAAVEQSMVALRQANNDLARTEIKSPIQGLVVERQARLGQTVAPGPNQKSLFTIACNMKFLAVDKPLRSQLDEGHDVSFTVSQFPNGTFHGRVTKTRLIDGVEVFFENADRRFRPGMTATADFGEIERHQDVLLAPSKALDWEPQWFVRAGSVQKFLWIKDPSLPKGVRSINVMVGLNNGQMAEVSGPEVKEGLEVIVGEATNPEPAEPKTGESKRRAGDVSPLFVRRRAQETPFSKNMNSPSVSISSNVLTTWQGRSFFLTEIAAYT